MFYSNFQYCTLFPSYFRRLAHRLLKHALFNRFLLLLINVYVLACEQLTALEFSLTAQHADALERAIATERANAAKALATEKQKAEETLHQVTRLCVVVGSVAAVAVSHSRVLFFLCFFFQPSGGPRGGRAKAAIGCPHGPC